MKPKEFLITNPAERIWANCKLGITPRFENKKITNTIVPDTITYVLNIRLFLHYIITKLIMNKAENWSHPYA